MSKVMIQRINIVSFTKWLTFVFFVLGIFAGIIYTTSFAISGQISGIVIIWYLLLTPILYTLVGIITSLIICITYNSLNTVLGGIVIEVSNSTFDFDSPPPPPENWSDNSSLNSNIRL